jgi:hypothetical protein
MKLKTQYSYTVAGIGATTREAARIIQRSIKADKPDAKAPRIVQQIVMQRVVR